MFLTKNKVELTYLKNSITPYCVTITAVSIATKIDNGVRVAVDNLVAVLTQSFIDLFVWKILTLLHAFNSNDSRMCFICSH